MYRSGATVLAWPVHTHHRNANFDSAFPACYVGVIKHANNAYPVTIPNYSIINDY
jgi:hypothetical protein